MIKEVEKRGANGMRTVVTTRPAEQYKVGSGETLEIIFLAAGGLASGRTQTCRITLKGKGARARFLGFVIGQESQKFGLNVYADHEKGENFSAVRIKSALYGASRLDFTGNLRIEKDAKLSDTFLSCHGLLMGKNAVVRTIPSLEIMTDDVKAGHAATAGQMNEEDLFYLLSRGIPRREAEHLLVIGFFEEQLERITDIDLRDSLRQAIIKSLPF